MNGMKFFSKYLRILVTVVHFKNRNWISKNVFDCQVVYIKWDRCPVCACCVHNLQCKTKVNTSKFIMTDTTRLVHNAEQYFGFRVSPNYFSWIHIKWIIFVTIVQDTMTISKIVYHVWQYSCTKMKFCILSHISFHMQNLAGNPFSA